MPDPHEPVNGSLLQLKGLFAQLKKIDDKLTNLHQELVPATVVCPYSLAELTSCWVEERCPARSRDLERSRLAKWILRAPIGEVRGQALTTATLDDWPFRLEREGASPSKLNHLRASLSRVFNQAIKASKWLLPNPVYPIAKRRER